MAEPDLATLKREVVGTVKTVKRRQALTWDLVMNDVDAASEKVGLTRQSLIEKRVRDLAAGTHPTLLESIFGLLVTAIPVAAVVKGLMSHWARTMEIGKAVRVLGSKTTDAAKAAKEIKNAEVWNKMLAAQRTRGSGSFKPDKLQLRPSRAEFVRETIEYNANLTKFSDLYSTEVSVSIRNLIKSAAEKSAKPLVSQDQVFEPTSVRKGGEEGDASDYLKGVRDWIVRSQRAEEALLEDTKEEAERTNDLNTLKVIKGFIEWEGFSDAHLKENYDREAFQRYVEMCIWCTTWDFRPRFVQGGRASLYGFRGHTTPHFETPPLGDEFWNFACKRYYDPFYGDGTKSYLDIGRTKQLGQVPPSSVSPEVARYTAGKNIDPGFYPAERLAFHWGNIIAPSLLNLNQEVAQALERQLRMNKKQHSEPTEKDVFYQYLLGLQKFES